MAQAPRGLNSVGNEILEGVGRFVMYTRAPQMENRNPGVCIQTQQAGTLVLAVFMREGVYANFYFLQ